MKKIVSVDCTEGFHREGFFIYDDVIPRMLSEPLEKKLIFDSEKRDSLKTQLKWFDTQVPHLRVAKKQLKEALQAPVSPMMKSAAVAVYKENLDMMAAHLHDLNESASWLFRRRLIEEARSVFEKALALANEFIPGHKLTVTLSSNLGALLIETDAHQKGAHLLEAAILTYRGSAEMAECLSVSTYRLAGYRMNQNRMDEAQTLLQESKAIRETLFSADSVEMDRVKLMEASLLSRTDHLDEAKRLFVEIFEKRNAVDPFGLDLIPVLEHLITIAEEEKHGYDECSSRIHIKEIYRRHFGEVDIRTILANLRVMNSFQYHAPQEDLDLYLFKAEEWMSQFPVTRESSQVGLCYAELAYATYGRQFCTQEMLLDQKKELISKALVYSLKASRHLHASKTLDLRSLGKLKDFETACMDTSRFLENMSHFSREPGKMGPVFYDRNEEKTDPVSAQSDHQTEKELASLSEFSSEVDYSKIPDQDMPLTVEDFRKLPTKGVINPYRLRVAQGGISMTFSDGRPLKALRDLLSADPAFAHKVSPVEIGIHNKKIYSFDTRRLIVHMMAKKDNDAVLIQYKKIEGPYLKERIGAIFTPRPWNGYVTAIRHGGKWSDSEPFICPPLEIQLSDAVAAGFKCFPKDRTHADLNGFMPKQAAAKKIYKFLMGKKKLGSKFAKRVIEEAVAIATTSSRGEANQFLIGCRDSVLEKPS